MCTETVLSSLPAEVESHPFDVDTMLFMDWRDDHLADLPEVKARNSKLPTFLYAMPFTKNKVNFTQGSGTQGRPLAASGSAVWAMAGPGSFSLHTV